jgi:hypothetical protein
MNRIALAGLAVFTLFAGQSARAADTRLAVPGQGWEVRFDAPAYEKKSEHDSPEQYRMAGNGGRFNLSFFVETPTCAAGLGNEALVGCYKEALARNPMVVPATVRASALSKGVSVMYIIQGDWKGQKVSLFNVNVLFAHRGKQGDLHVSIVEPQSADIEALVKLAQSFDIVDTTPEPAAPGASAAN